MTLHSSCTLTIFIIWQLHVHVIKATYPFLADGWEEEVQGPWVQEAEEGEGPHLSPSSEEDLQQRQISWG